MDLHVHTPASSDYQQKDVDFIHILQQAEERGIDILAFTDHNTVRGYARMWREIEDLELLEALGRLSDSEAALLSEYRRLLNKILLLPGFEFTATFGFHILAIFPEDTSIRKLEHTLLSLNIPEEKIDLGTSEVGATTDVLKAYEVLNRAGALVIGAHVNSTHGIAMQGFPFGGQTKIAYTQNPNLHALEATDLDSASPRSTARFFNGTKPEYPRRMHVIQGSDAHRLTRDPERETNLGVGDRVTEVCLPELSFAALKQLFESDDFARVRPYRPGGTSADLVLAARAEGNTLTQAFHERLGGRRSKTPRAILRDIVAFANTQGGTVYVGLDATAGGEILGIPRAREMAQRLKAEALNAITPELPLSVDVQAVGDRDILVISVPQGQEKPYALTPGEIYVRHEGESAIASRDAIVQMVRSSLAPLAEPASPTVDLTEPEEPEPVAAEPPAAEAEPSDAVVEEATAPSVPLPTTGVEIVSSEERDGVMHHTMRDLRSLRIVENVTRSSARRLWRYAIIRKESGEAEPEAVQWHGRMGFLRAHKQRGGLRYDLAYRDNGQVRIFFGVTDKSLPEPWRAVVPDRVDEPGEEAVAEEEADEVTVA